MKNKIYTTLLFLFSVFTLTNCQLSEPLTNRAEQFTSFGIDFRTYAEKGFLFLPGDYFGEYIVLGVITAELHPEVKYIDGIIPVRREGFKIQQLYHNSKVHTQVISPANVDDLIEYVYQLAVEWGGDAFTRFESSIQIGKTDDKPYSSYPFYSISGMVIKRK